MFFLQGFHGLFSRPEGDLVVVLVSIGAVWGGFCAYFWVFLSRGSLVAFFLGIRIGGEVSLLPSQGVLCFWWLAAHVGVFINLFRLFFLVNCEAGLVALRVRVASRSDLKLLEVVHIGAWAA